MSRRQRTQKKPRAKGALVILVLLFVSSAALRVATSANEVLAEAKSVLAKTHHIENETATSTASKHLSETYFNKLLVEFNARETELKVKELDLEKRLIVLEETEKRVLAQLEKMKQSEQMLRDTLALASTAAEDDLARLTTVYESMKPKTASALFEEMAPDFAAGFISRMRPDSAALVMAGMSSEAAYLISTILAGRHANVPKE